jgi:hypothetical protein
MNRIVEIRELLIDALNGVLQNVVGYSPQLLAAVALIVLGFAAAAVARWMVRTGLERARFDRFLESVGARQAFAALSERDPSEIVARIGYWVVLILFVQAAIQTIGLTVISSLVQRAIAYLPSLLAAVLVVLGGLVVGRFISGVVSRSARSLGESHATALGRMSSAVILVVTGIMAIGQLGIQVVVLQSMFVALLIGAALAGALTFGLGSREVTRSMLAGFYARKLFHSGDEVLIGGQKGKLVSITQTQTVIESRGSLKAVPNETFLHSVTEKRIG